VKRSGPGCRRSFAFEPGQALLTWAAGGAIVVRGGAGAMAKARLKFLRSENT
jgi:hypothetical protein